MPIAKTTFLTASVLLGGMSGALAQQAAPAAAQAAPTAAASAPAAAPAASQAASPAPQAANGVQSEPGFAGKLVLLFPTGGASLDAQNLEILDKASRLYREGKPIVMVVSGSTDSTGSAAANLELSQRRANAVAQGLLARGIPAERTEVLAKGEASPAVEAPKGTPEAQNRRVEIAWR